MDERDTDKKRLVGNTQTTKEVWLSTKALRVYKAICDVIQDAGIGVVDIIDLNNQEWDGIDKRYRDRFQYQLTYDTPTTRATFTGVVEKSRRWLLVNPDFYPFGQEEIDRLVAECLRPAIVAMQQD